MLPSARGLAPSFSLVALFAVAPVGSLTAQPHPIESYAGQWVLVGGQADMAAGINRVADQMNFFIREIARGEMHRRLHPERRIRLHIEEPGSITFSYDRWGPVRFRVNAPAIVVPGPEGDPVRATMRFERGRLVYHHVGGNGQRTSTFTLSPDARRMFLAARIGSNQLPSDIQYRLVYGRPRPARAGTP